MNELWVDAREEKLPRWAQEKLSRLRQTVTELDTTVTRLRHEGVVETDTVVDPYHDAIKLEPGTRVRFSVSSGDYVDVQLRYGGVDLLGSGDLAIQPWARNHAVVQVGRL